MEPGFTLPSFNELLESIEISNSKKDYGCFGVKLLTPPETPDLTKIIKEYQERKPKKVVFYPCAYQSIHQRKHQCPFPNCGASFKRTEHLRRHENSHVGLKLFDCEKCGRSFTRKEGLTYHSAKCSLPPSSWINYDFKNFNNK